MKVTEGSSVVASPAHLSGTSLRPVLQGDVTLSLAAGQIQSAVPEGREVQQADAHKGEKGQTAAPRIARVTAALRPYEPLLPSFINWLVF